MFYCIYISVLPANDSEIDINQATELQHDQPKDTGFMAKVKLLVYDNKSTEKSVFFK